jgi:hypothetical protein
MKETETVIDENPRIETMVEEPWPYLVIENFLPEGRTVAIPCNRKLFTRRSI